MHQSPMIIPMPQEVRTRISMLVMVVVTRMVLQLTLALTMVDMAAKRIIQIQMESR